MLKEGKAVEIVDKSLEVLLHDDLVDSHSQLLLYDGFRKNELKVVYTKLFKVFVLYCELIH